MEGEWEKGGGRVGERWRESVRKVEGECEKGGGRVGERWRESGRKVEGEWEKCGGRVGEMVEGEWEKGGGRVGERWRESGRERDGEEGKKRARAQAIKRLIGRMKTSFNVIQMVDPFWSFSKHTTPTLNTHLVDVFLQYISPR